eukprot:416342_1
MQQYLFSRSNYYLNKKRYFGSCVFFISIAMILQLLLLLVNWNHFNFFYRFLYQIFFLYARISRSAHLPHLNDSQLPEHHLCYNNVNKIVSCEMVAYELLLSKIMPKYGPQTDRSQFISQIRRTEAGTKMMLTSPYGAIYESYSVHDLECFLVHSVPTDYQHLSEIYANGVIIYLHGGAFVSGSAKILHRFMTYLHLFSSLPVLGVDYKLAPEYPLQSGAILEDGYKIIIEHLYKEMNVNLRNIYLIGDSAGGAVALMIMQHLSILNFSRLGGAVLMSPGVDIDNDPNISPSLIENAKYDVFLSMDAINVFKEFIFGCRDINGNINKIITINGSVNECVEREIKKMKDFIFNYKSWKNMNKSTNILFMVCEYEILRDGVINVYNLSKTFGIYPELYMIKNSNIHALPVMVSAPEAIKAISYAAHTIINWSKQK